MVASYSACELENKLLSSGRCRKASLIPEVRVIHISMMWFHAADTLNSFDAFKRTFHATPSARRKRVNREAFPEKEKST